MYNDWPDSIRFLFLDDNYWKCWGCGENHANCGHHIFGRGRSEGCEKSAFNFAPMNNHYCHLPRHGYWMTDQGRKELLQKTIDYLSSIRYTLRDIDNEFLQKYGAEIYKLKIKI